VYNPQGLSLLEIVVASALCSWAMLSVCTVGALALSWWVFGDEKAAKPAPQPAPQPAPAQPAPAATATVAHA
jgi:hypothetical protein